MRRSHTQEHTWYEGYRLSYQDRPHIPERHDWDGLKVKQTFYIVRSFLSLVSLLDLLS